jgi:aspartate/methionine/tyrosine aminotransferase
MFKNLPVNGIMAVMNKARDLGFSPKNENWVNFGQGAPTTAHIEGDVPRSTQISFDDTTYGYNPVNGIVSLRKQLSGYYNQLFGSTLGMENILVAGGARSVLACFMSMLEAGTTVGYLNPDYAQYTEIVGIFGPNVNTVAIELDSNKGFEIDLDLIEKAIAEQGLKVFMFSNPSNPTGNCLSGDQLQRLVDISEKYDCYVICDEIYGRYYYEGSEILSIVKYIKNPKTTKIIAIDGLSKGFRYPSWRVGWCVANPDVVNSLEASNSAFTGGASGVAQIGSLELIDADLAMAQKQVLATNFKQKRDYLVSALREIGFGIKVVPQGAFYVWTDISGFPNGLNTCKEFVQKMLENNVILVSGDLFDVNPNSKRQGKKWQNYVRFAFGQDLETIKKGVEIIRKVVEEARK